MNTIPLRHIPAMLLALGALGACDEKTSEEKGKAAATTQNELAKGYGSGLEATGAAAGEAVVSGVATVFKGMEKGAVKARHTIIPDATLASAGLQVTTIEEIPYRSYSEAEQHGLLAYIVSNTAARGTLRVKLYNVIDKEIGRTRIELDRAADDAKFELVAVDKQLDVDTISKIAFSFVPAQAPAKK